MPAIFTSDGTEIDYRVHGNGPVVLLFLHGWGGSAQTWDEVAAHLDATRCRVVSVDLRGHGRSGAPANGYRIQDFSGDVLAVADAVGAKHFIPVGFSMGGKLASYLAAKHPERVASLVLIAPAAPGKAPVDRASALQAIRQAGDWRQYETVFKNWFAPGTAAEIVKACCQTIARTPLPVLETTAELFLWTSLADEIGRLEQPSLLVVGEHDPVYGVAYQKLETLPFLNRPSLVTLPSGHFVPLEQPAELARFLAAFVTQC